jgi:type II secretory pathway pseudopilin PulG
MKSKGFTVIETLLIVVLISILAAILIPRFTIGSKQAKIQACEMNRSIINTMTETFYFMEGTWPNLDLDVFRHAAETGAYDSVWVDSSNTEFDPAIPAHKAALTNLAGKYFPDGIPTCPVDEISYELSPSPIYRVSGHREGSGTHEL